MTETINITLDSDDLKEFKETTGMNIIDCVKYGGKVEFDQFWSDENMDELKKRIDDAKHGRNMHEHDLIEV